LTERVRAVHAVEEAERRAPRAPRPGDLQELEDATPSAFARAVIEATRTEPSRVPSTLRAAAPPREPASKQARRPVVEQLLEEELVRPPKLYRDVVAECGNRAVMDALRRTGGNKALAARQLGLTREGLYNVLRRAGTR
jgi:DNA-binding NtrC family response regulator